MVWRNYHALHEEVWSFTTLLARLAPCPRLSAFNLADPYACPGTYRKAQLHVHTSNSIDVLEKLPVAETIRRYKEAGCSFVVVTDHDRVTDVAGLSTPELAVLTGEEETIPVVMWPLGRHFLRLGVGGEDELRAPAHPNWAGNLGTGRWHLADLLARSDYRLFEIYNGKSNSTLDFWLWHQVLARRGAADPVWGIAVDDTDNAVAIDGGWVMVKTADVTPKALLKALRQGCFYATNGPQADFRTADGMIQVETSGGAWIRFIDARNEVVAAFRGDRASYRPLGDEGFVRVEVVSKAGRAAWSQPFFLVPEDSEAISQGRQGTCG